MTNSAPAQERILEHLNTAVLVVADDLHVVAVNPAAEALLESSANALIGLDLPSLFVESTSIQAQLARTLMQGASIAEREVELRTLACNKVLVDCLFSLFDDAAGETYAIVEIVHQERFKQMSREERLLAQNESSRAVLRGLAHEIRNPLGGLRGAAQLLQRQLDSDELRDYTEVIIREADRLQNLLDRMLGPRTPPQRRRINLHEVTERVFSLIHAEAPSAMEILKDYDPSIPEFVADPEQLIQAVLNVGRNAIQALTENESRDAKIKIKTRIHKQTSIGQQRHKLVARLEIEDNGPGVPESLQNQIFYPLVTGRQDGTGLGLSIAQSIVRQHGGLIECSSTPGRTVFTILLPVDEGEV